MQTRPAEGEGEPWSTRDPSGNTPPSSALPRSTLCNLGLETLSGSSVLFVPGVTSGVNVTHSRSNESHALEPR